MKKLLFQVAAFFALPILKGYWFVFRPKGLAVKCIVRHGDEILLIRNSYGLKLWTLPGGGVHRGESVEDAALREVKEEVGITLSSLQKRGSIYFDGEYKRTTIWVFVADVSSREFTIDGLEVEEARWFKYTELPTRRSNLLSRFLLLAELETTLS